jgi:hypothetical protein
LFAAATERPPWEGLVEEQKDVLAHLQRAWAMPLALLCCLFAAYLVLRASSGLLLYYSRQIGLLGARTYWYTTDYHVVQRGQVDQNIYVEINKKRRRYSETRV